MERGKYIKAQPKWHMGGTRHGGGRRVFLPQTSGTMGTEEAQAGGVEAVRWGCESTG